MAKKKIPNKFKTVVVVSRKALERWVGEKITSTQQARKIVQDMVEQDLSSF